MSIFVCLLMFEIALFFVRVCVCVCVCVCVRKFVFRFSTFQNPSFLPSKVQKLISELAQLQFAVGLMS